MTYPSNEEIEGYGDDALKWAKGFNETAQKLGYSEMDEGWLIGWFANAIERSHSLRMEKLREKLRDVVTSDFVGGINAITEGLEKVDEALQWT